MKIIDTHSHIYLDNFKDDIDETINRAFNNFVTKIILPNIDENSVNDVFNLCNKYPNSLFPALGLHPTSVTEKYKLQLDAIFDKFNNNVIAIGEIGIDLYWDKSLKQQQIDAFKIQLEFASDKNLPVIIHSRDSMREIIEVIENINNTFKGVFHCFSGNQEQAKYVIDKGFYIGVGGVITYKKSELPEIIANIPIEKIIVETDSPFLPPTPNRGKRNEPAYIINTVNKIAEIKKLDVKTVADFTSQNAELLFNI